MADWIVSIIETTGYFGIALLMLVENVFPPIPSELIMPFAGFAAANGSLGFVPVVLAGTVGSILGAVFWYGVGAWLGRQRLRRWTARHGRWLTIAPEDLDNAQGWFRRHGRMAVLIGRLVPAVRTLISVPAGVAAMPLPSFLLWSTVGTLVWTTALTALGYVLGDAYGEVGVWINGVTWVVVLALVAGYVYRVISFQQPDAREPARR